MLGQEFRCLEFELVIHIAAEERRLDDTRRQSRAIRREREFFRTNPGHDAAGRRVGAHLAAEIHGVIRRKVKHLAGQRGPEQVGMADEGGHEGIGRTRVNRLRRIRLLDDALAHHRDAVGDAQCFFLIMGHVNRGNADLFLDVADRPTHFHAQLGVEVRERLVHEQHARMHDNRTGQGDTLLLAPGQAFGQAVLIVLNADGLEHLIDPPLRIGWRHVAELQAVLDILAHGQMREDRIVLEDHADIALVRRNAVDDLIIETDVAGFDAVETGDHAQQGGLAAARGPQQGKKLAVLDIDGKIGNDRHGAILLGHVLNMNGNAHGLTSDQ